MIGAHRAQNATWLSSGGSPHPREDGRPSGDQPPSGLRAGGHRVNVGCDAETGGAGTERRESYLSALSFAIRYCLGGHYAWAHKHGISDIDIEHAVNRSVVTDDQEDGKVLYLGPVAPGTSWRLCRCVETTELRS